MAEPALSVVIPTYRRTASLMRTLASLQGQDAAFEIVVVDNAADAGLRDALEQFNESAKVPARWVPEPTLGLHHARNAGAAQARGELLAYTDDDVTIAPGWVRAYLDVFAAHPELSAAGGPSRPEWEEPPPRWLLALVNRRPTFFQLSLRDVGTTLRLDEQEPFWGLNMVVRRSALVAAGGFNPELVGGECVGDGEGGLFRKLRAAGKRVAYVPGAVVHHRIPAERMTLSYLLTRMRGEGHAEAYASARRGRRGLYLTLVWLLVKNAVLGVVYAAATALPPLRWSRDVFPLRVRMLASERLGRAAYAWGAITSASRRAMILRDDWMPQGRG